MLFANIRMCNEGNKMISLSERTSKGSGMLGFICIPIVNSKLQLRLKLHIDLMTCFCC
jgi:hypothetical protein